jgi:hypothetical protein
MNPAANSTRREFIRTSGRCLGLGGLAALVAAGELKRRRLDGRADCIKLSTCADCVELGGCPKPKADNFRRSRG